MSWLERVVGEQVVRGVARFFSDLRANVAIVFAIGALPLTIAAGLAIEQNAVWTARNSLQAATDAAVLAAAVHAGDAQSARQRGEQVFHVNLTEAQGLNNASINIVSIDNGYRAVATADFTPMMGKLVGVGAHEVEVDAEAMAEGSGVEIVLAFDVTNSMGFGTSWSDGKAAVRRLLESLEAGAGDNDFFVSFVPFTDRVNVGDRTDIYDPDHVDRTEHRSWRGCAEPREESLGSFPYSLSDAPPSELGFIPRANGLSGGLWERGNGYPRCSRSEIVPPSDDISGILRALDRLNRTGTGRFDVGLAWGWRLLSPRWSGQWGLSDYPIENTGDRMRDRRKILVMFTDGYTEAYRYEVGGPTGVFGWNRGGRIGFEHMVDLCQRIRASGVELYVVYVNGQPDGRPYMQQCGGEAGFFDVSNTETLEKAFTAIRLGHGRVRLTH